jgi:hypothetical protein
MSSNWFAVTAFLCHPLVFEGASISGRIVDDSLSMPVRHVVVRVLNSKTGAEFANLSTDARGEFQVPDLPEKGQYKLEMAKTGFLTLCASLGALQDSPLLFRLIGYGVITGRVIDAESNPVRTARVTAFRKGREADVWESVGSPLEVDGDGNYRIHGLPPGTYRVGAFGMTERGHAIRGLVFFPDNSQPMEFRVLGGEEYSTTDIRLPVGSGFSVSGRVHGEGEDGNILLSAAPVEEPGIVLTVALARPGGLFHLENMLPGTYQLVARRGSSGADASFGRAKVIVPAPNNDITDIALGKAGASISLRRSPSDDSSGPCGSPVTASLVPVEGNRPKTLGASILLYRGRPTLLSALEPGVYRVTIDAPKGCENSGPQYIDWTGEPDGPPRDLGMMLPAGSIRAHVVNVDESSHYSVILVPFGCRESDCQVHFARPDRDGNVVFDHLPAGDYYAIARRSTALDARWRPVPGRDTDAITVTPGVRVDVQLSNAR